MTLDISSAGQIFAKCQVTDYLCHGEALSECNMIDFVVDTYEVDILPRDKAEIYTKRSEGWEADSDNEDVQVCRPGQPHHDRILYLSHHPKAEKKQQKFRSRGHHNLPNFIGQYFPRRDDPKTYLFYCACMLLLLKPWRDIGQDLKGPSQTWSKAFESFLGQASQHTRFILSGIQYFHECESAAKKSRVQDLRLVEEINLCNSHAFNEDIGNDELGEDYVEINSGFSEEGLVQLIASQTPTDELHHTLLAIEIAKRSKIFPNHGAQWQVRNESLVGNASGDDFVKLMQWKAQMKRDIVMQNTDSDTLHTVEEDSGVQVD